MYMPLKSGSCWKDCKYETERHKDCIDFCYLDRRNKMVWQKRLPAPGACQYYFCKPGDHECVTDCLC